MAGIALIYVIITAIALITICIYYFVYKRHINNALIENNGKHISMPSVSSILTVVVAAVLLLCNIISIQEINKMRNELWNIRDDIDNDIVELNEAVNDNASEINKELKSNKSMITLFDYDYGSFDKETQTGEINLTVIPKEVSENTEVSVNFGNDSIKLKKDKNNKYTGTARVDIFKDYDYNPTITISNGEVTKSELLDEENAGIFNSIYSVFLPVLEATFYENEFSFSKEKLNIQGSLDISSYEKNENGIGFKNCRMEIINNNRKVFEEELTLDKNENASNFDIDKTIPAKKNDIIQIYVTAEDTAGYIHKVCVLNNQGNQEVDLISDVEDIYDKSGKNLTNNL